MYPHADMLEQRREAACMRAYRVGDSIVFILVVITEIYQISVKRIKRGTPS